MCFVYLETSIVNSWGERPAPVRDFVPNEATETEDVLCVPRGFGCAQLGERQTRRGISSQMKERKPKTYFVYFKASVLRSWGKRSAR